MLGGNMGKDVDETVAHTVMETLETTITNMSIKITVEAVVKQKGTFQKTEEEVMRIHFEGDKDNGMVMNEHYNNNHDRDNRERNGDGQNNANRGKVTEVKDIVTGGEGGDGILTHNTHNRITHNSPIIPTPITIAHCQWAINTSSPCHMNNTLPILKHNCNTHHQDCQRDHTNSQIYVNCAKIRVIMIINANLQAISSPVHIKPLTKVVHITIKIPITANGQMGKMTKVTPMANLFSKGGSQCC